MKRWYRACLPFLVIGLWSSGVAAQDALPPAGEATGGANENVIYKKETVYDFEGDDVEGALVRPDEANIQGEQHSKTSSLIKIRSDFVPELLKSVEDL